MNTISLPARRGLARRLATLLAAVLFAALPALLGGCGEETATTQTAGAKDAADVALQDAAEQDGMATDTHVADSASDAAEADTTSPDDSAGSDADTAGPADTVPDAAPDAEADGGIDSGNDAGADTTAPNQCQTVEDCPAPPACHLAVCSPKGLCAVEVQADGSACDDGNACSTGDTCTAGICAGATPLLCDDENPCTTDKCNPLAGCINLPAAATTACDDGDACTQGDTCQGGKCASGLQICQCKTTADCGKYEDGNLCNGTLYCDTSGNGPNTCKLNPASLIVCPTGQNSPCQQNTCIPSTGACELVAAPEASPCSDGDACTVGDYCDKGLCHGGSNTCFCKQDSDCAGQEDGNACNGTLFCNKATAQCQVNPAKIVVCQTADDTFCQQNLCNPKDGKCYFVPVHEGKGCDDGNACTPNETCQKGECQTKTNTCECQSDKDCAKLEDGNLCNGTLYCDLQAAKCVVNPASVVHCNTNDDPACLRDVCNPASGKCEAQSLPKDGTPCDDGNPCTTFETCQSGQCTATANTCECQQDADCATKEDGNLCNGTLICDKKAGKCVLNPATVVECPAAFDEVCLKNQCDPKTGQCGMKPALQGNQCPGKNACSAGGWCDLGECVVSAASVCACQVDSDCLKFEDGDLCNGTLYCDTSGAVPVCKDNPSTIVVCPKGQDTACQKNQCDPAKGTCSMTAATGACDDGDPCTVADLCASGTCAGGTPLVCNDNNACTTDTCKPGFGCVYQSLKADACDDGNPCTGDLCQPTQGCAHTYLTGTCSDGDACTTGDACSSGLCTGQAVDCGDGNPCTDDPCTAKQGCQHAPNSATCSDGDACTTGDTCSLGTCAGQGKLACDDGNPCTTDSCAAKFGCQYGFAPGQCSDGNLCTQNDACKDGACTGTATACSDDNACTDDACDPKQGCVFAPNTAPCSDGNACTSGDKCGAGKCGYAQTTACNDGNPCTDDGCDPKQGCTATANTAACDDGNVCTVKDICSGGSCGGTLQCNDNNPCTDDSCSAGKCAYANNTLPCSDGNACSTSDTCAGGTCKGPGKLSCDDNNVCTDDGCDAGSGCTHAANSAACDDGNACTTGDGCKGNLCGGSKLSCDDGNVCTDDSCDPKTGCVYAANSAPCDDGAACTVGDACAASKCAPGKAKDCSDGNVCTTDSCVAATGQCSNVDTSGKDCNDGNPCTDDLCHPLLGCGHTNNSAPCSDGNPCTTGDGCKNAKCEATGSLNCNDSNVCTDDSCDPKQGCVHTDNTAPCNDNIGCTQNDVCAKGTCGGKLQCDDKNPCTSDACDFTTGNCAYTKLAGDTCNDGNACTANDFCQGGACVPGKLVVCDDGNVCSDDYCDSASGCGVKPNTAACDLTGCSIGDTCKDFSCIASSVERVWNKSSTDDSPSAAVKEVWTGAVLMDDESCLLSASYAASPYYSTKAVFGKVHANGNRVWTNSIASVTGISYSTTVLRRTDGTVMLGGINAQCGFVAPIDAAGNVGTAVKIKHAICATSSNGFQIPVALLDRTVAGKSVLTAVILRDEYAYRLVVADVEADGSVLNWFQHADTNNSYVNEPRAATVLTDGRIVVAGRTNEPGGGGGDDATLTFLQPDLTGEVRKRYGGAPNEIFHAIARLPDNTVVAAGARTTGSSAPEAIVMRMTADGTLLWQKAFTGTGAYELRAAVAADDGALFFAGKRPEAGNTAKTNLWMLALDADGDTFWSSDYGLADTDENAVALLRHSASGRLTAFGARMSANGTADFYGVRVTEGGAATCAAAGKCVPSITPTCSDSDPCTASLCFNNACVSQSQIAGCNDGDACTSGEVCSSTGACGSGSKVYCDDGNPCTTETCDKAAGCVYSTVVDGTPCATGKTCSAGVCK